MPKVRVKDIEMYYEIHGSGDPVVLIAGLTGTTKNWELQVPELEKHYRVLVFDNRGVGYTDKPDMPYSTRMFADDASGLMDKLGIAKAHIVGASMGGAIAQEFALNYPERVRSLTLSCTFHKADRYLMRILKVWREIAEKAGTITLMKEIIPWVFTREFYEAHEKEIEEVEKERIENPQPLRAFLNQCTACENHNTEGRLSKIKAPTLVIVGRDDLLTPPSFSEVIAKSIPGSELVVLGNSGHAFWTEVVDEAHKALFSFLKKH
jgi:pimeloyl-ACP methyl ester carboxylesterase